jgi:7-cyano-7-deazaguanine synthase in queuosine biosynthesis
VNGAGTKLTSFTFVWFAHRTNTPTKKVMLPYRDMLAAGVDLQVTTAQEFNDDAEKLWDIFWLWHAKNIEYYNDCCKESARAQQLPTKLAAQIAATRSLLFVAEVSVRITLIQTTMT